MAAMLSLAVGCASAGSDPDASATPPVVDAPTGGFPDAPGGNPDAPPGGNPDAQLPADAMQPPADAAMPDAPGSGLFCMEQSDCPDPNECCFFLVEPPGFCVVGTEVIGVCFPE